MELLFIYGTLLKKDFNNISRFLHKNAKYYKSGWFQGKLFEVNNYPGAISVENCPGIVFGEIFELSDAEMIFKVLDNYEEVGNEFPAPNEYLRQKIEIETEGNFKFIAWTYLYNHSTENLQQITSGNYAEFKNW